MRSRTGCLTCRQRKLKCDETKPICRNCTKASRVCQPSSGITFRHQQNASMNGVESSSAANDNLEGFYAYRNTFKNDHIWLDIPPEVTFINITDPYAEEETIEAFDRLHRGPNRTMNGAASPWIDNRDLDPPSALHNIGLEALSAAASADTQSYGIYPHDPSRSTIHMALPQQQLTQTVMPRTPSRDQRPISTNSPMNAITSTARSIASPLNQSNSDAATPIDPSLETSYSPRQLTGTGANMFSTASRISPPETDHEIAFLLRHYAEVLGYSMDLFDCGRYFSFHVPVKALKVPLLKYAACAYAAKQLGRVRGEKSALGGASSSQARMELWPVPGKVNWLFHAAKYYDKAISLLLEALEEQQENPSQFSGEMQLDGDRPDGRFPNPTPSRTSDELLAATAILCEYEAMDATGVAWSKHLNGTKSLLDVAEVGMHDDFPGSQNYSKFAGARKAIFWNFARQDFAAAFITESPARLDVNRHQMWRAAGLDLDESGCLISHTQLTRNSNDNHSREDMVANSLILLLSKLNNFISTGESLFPTPTGYNARTPEENLQSVEHLGVSQQSLLEKWDKIRQEIDVWFSNLPGTFTPCARIGHPVFSEIWFNIPMCASAMQNYHMAKIILLINKPHETTAGRSTVGNRLKSYQSIAAEIKHHAREICGIALSRPEGSVRIFSIQPLFVAGECLTETRERKVVLELLQNIEQDLGWATQYRIQQLLKEWNWNSV